MILSQRSGHSRAQRRRPGVPGGRANQLCPTPGRSTSGTGERRLGEITHLVVAPAAQGRGVGRALVKEACQLAESAKLELLVVVTHPGGGAEQFYSRSGWIKRGEMISRSKEHFVRYELTLPAGAATDRRVES